MQQRSVRDLMRIRHGLVVAETATLRDVAERLISSDCDLMAVQDEHGKLAGVVFESSIVRALMANPPQDATIQSIMVRHAESVRLDVNLAAVQPLFRSCANTAIPVVDEDGCVCGLLMRSDVIRSLLNRATDTDDDSAKESCTTPTTSTTVSNSTAFKPPKTRTIHAGEAASSEDQNSPHGPHFLRADVARRVLWVSEDRL
ncbi:MAG TPA: CBS domain-containing protein [Planctomycetaceae bacterium]|nr:CBS domain-containing protein [Planctomycetaceae bacterium]